MCKGCGRSIIIFNTAQTRCAKCQQARSKAKPPKPLKRSTKPIKQKGKETMEYDRWRDEVARPFLIQEYGEVCQIDFGARCGNQQLDVAHIDGRGSHHALKMNLANVRLVGRYPCHREETDHQVNGKFVPNNPHKFNMPLKGGDKERAA